MDQEDRQALTLLLVVEVAPACLDHAHGQPLVLARPARRIAPAASSDPPIRRTPPATSNPVATPSRVGYLAPRSARTSIPGRPSAFITTPVQVPSVGSQVRAWGPVPVAEATQKSCVPGGDAGTPPPTGSTLFPQKSEMRVWRTPAR